MGEGGGRGRCGSATRAGRISTTQGKERGRKIRQGERSRPENGARSRADSERQAWQEPLAALPGRDPSIGGPKQIRFSNREATASHGARPDQPQQCSSGAIMLPREQGGGGERAGMRDSSAPNPRRGSSRHSMTKGRDQERASGRSEGGGCGRRPERGAARARIAARRVACSPGGGNRSFRAKAKAPAPTPSRRSQEGSPAHPTSHSSSC